MTTPSSARAAMSTTYLSRLRRVIGRLGWGVADQALSSLTNFAVGIYVARTLGAEEFGAFSLAFATYLIVRNASQGLASDPLVVRYSGVDTMSWRSAVAKSTGMAITIGLLTGTACVVVGWYLGGSTGAAFLALGISLPGLLLQDSWRYAFFCLGRGGKAFGNDLVWTLVLLPLLPAIVATGHSGVFWFVLAWGLSATFAAVVGGIQARVVPRLSEAANWLAHHRDLASRYLGENLTLSGAAQLRLYGLGIIAGLTAVGTLRAAELLLGPFMVITQGIGMIGVPEAARTLRRSLRRLQPFCLLLAGLQAGGAIVWGAAMLLLPESVGVWLLGSSWQPASALLVPVTLAVAGTGVVNGAWVGLRALGAATRSLRARGINSVAYLVGVLGGAALGGAAGAAWGATAGTFIGAGVWWWQLHRGIRSSDVSGA
jgi:O-antigen/teichoic acid export membrane protein